MREGIDIGLTTLRRILFRPELTSPQRRRSPKQERAPATHKLRPASDFTITDKQLFQVNGDGQTIASRQCGFTLLLRSDESLKGLDVRTLHQAGAGQSVQLPRPDTTKALLPARGGAGY